MTGKIERQVGEHHTTLRLIGHLHAAHLGALRAQLEGNGPRAVLDLDQVTLVDVAVVRFLGYGRVMWHIRHTGPSPCPATATPATS